MDDEMSENILASKWILSKKDQSTETKPRLRLLCFPQAGSGAWVYQEWQSQCPEDVQVLPIELPGKNTRMRELCFTSMEGLVQDAVEELSAVFHSSVPFAFFGHSMGSWIAYALTQELQRRNWNLPVKLYVSGARSPKLAGPDYDPDGFQMHQLEPTEFWKVFEKRYGHNKDLEDDAVRRFVYPVLKSDFQVAETYRPVSQDPLICPVAVSGGTEDVRINEENMAAWTECVSANQITFRWFPGGHDYLFKEKESKAAFMDYLCSDLSNVLHDGLGTILAEDDGNAQKLEHSNSVGKEAGASVPNISADGSSCDERTSRRSFSEAAATVASSGSHMQGLLLSGAVPSKQSMQMNRDDGDRLHDDTTQQGTDDSELHLSESPRKGFFDCIFCR